MACNPHFNERVVEKQVSHTPNRKVVEIVSAPKGESPKK
jgi:hypothetical protein